MYIISQLLSDIPLNLVDQAVTLHNSDNGYKKLKTKENLVFLLYGVVGKL
jgi:hypothetical protein